MFQHTKSILFASLLMLSMVGCSTQDAQSEAPSQTTGSRVSAESSSVAASRVPDAAYSKAPSSETQSAQAASGEVESSVAEASSSAASADAVTSAPATEIATTAVGELTVHFGDSGAPFTMHLYDNSTAAAIADYVGTADWRLPIYNDEDYDNWEVMQYYDLPSRYEIPSNAETISTEKAGEVYYSEPNRMVLFYGDAEVTGEYTRVGYFEATEEFVSAVQSNPVLEGWGNKIVLIKD